MKYFKIGDFIVSDTAKENGIDNTPEQWQIDNCEEMVEKLLDPLREAWAEECKTMGYGTPAIGVSSGIRSKALNKAVGGSTTSSHFIGSAADIYPYNGHLLKFKQFCYIWLQDKEFDQMISEKESVDGTPRWIHLGYKRYNDSQRKNFLSNIGDKYMPITKV